MKKSLFFFLLFFSAFSVLAQAPTQSRRWVKFGIASEIATYPRINRVLELPDSTTKNLIYYPGYSSQSMLSLSYGVDEVNRRWWNVSLMSNFLESRGNVTQLFYNDQGNLSTRVIANSSQSITHLQGEFGRFYTPADARRTRMGIGFLARASFYQSNVEPLVSTYFPTSYLEISGGFGFSVRASLLMTKRMRLDLSMPVSVLRAGIERSKYENPILTAPQQTSTQLDLDMNFQPMFRMELAWLLQPE